MTSPESNGQQATGPQAVRIDADLVGTVAVLRVRGEIDIVTAPQLQDAAERVLVSAPTRLVLDLTGVGFLASAGLAVLVTCRRRCGDGIEFRVVADSAAVLRPLELTGLDTEFTVVRSLDAALQP